MRIVVSCIDFKVKPNNFFVIAAFVQDWRIVDFFSHHPEAMHMVSQTCTV